MILLKSSVVGLTVIVGVVTPVPVNDMVTLLTPGLLRVTVAVRVPVAEGVKVTVNVPPVLGNDVALTVKSPAFVPLFAMVIVLLRLATVTVKV